LVFINYAFHQAINIRAKPVFIVIPVGFMTGLPFSFA
jgi:hypothetical protein